MSMSQLSMQLASVQPQLSVEGISLLQFPRKRIKEQSTVTFARPSYGSSSIVFFSSTPRFSNSSHRWLYCKIPVLLVLNTVYLSIDFLSKIWTIPTQRSWFICRFFFSAQYLLSDTVWLSLYNQFLCKEYTFTTTVELALNTHPGSGHLPYIYIKVFSYFAQFPGCWPSR